MKNFVFAILLMLVMINISKTENVVCGMKLLSTTVVSRSSCLNDSQSLTTIGNNNTEIAGNGSSHDVNVRIRANVAHVVSASIITTIEAAFLMVFRILQGDSCKMKSGPDGLVTVSLA